MKRVLIILIASVCLNGCEKHNMIIDWAPITFKIQVQDSQGNDMLDPSNDNTWLLGTEVIFIPIFVIQIQDIYLNIK